jgi:putative SbcD/Mre11-related phosphoesterase
MRVHTDWLLTPERAAVHVPTGTAVIADLHLGYDRARQRSGEAVPTTTLDDTLTRLTALFASPVVRRLLIAGDLVENRAGSREVTELVARLQNAGVELLGLVPGNHDRELLAKNLALPVFADGFDIGGWRVVHGDGPLARGRRVLGHHHPCIRWRSSITAPCYLMGKRDLILPAFSLDAAGVNVLRTGRWRSYRCGVIVGREVLDFGELARLRRPARPKRRDERSRISAPSSEVPTSGR